MDKRKAEKQSLGRERVDTAFWSLVWNGYKAAPMFDSLVLLLGPVVMLVSPHIVTYIYGGIDAIDALPQPGKFHFVLFTLPPIIAVIMVPIAVGRFYMFGLERLAGKNSREKKD